MVQGPERSPTVELWCTRVRPVDPALLAPADRRRWEEFVVPADRDRLATAVLLRNHVLGSHGHATRITRWCPVCRTDQHGGVRPPDGATWRLSVSHAEDVVVIGYAGTAAVELGVDVEQVARFRPEMARFVQGPGERRTGPHALAETWTAKEAVLKAAGCGLHVNPTALEIRRSAATLQHGPTQDGSAPDPGHAQVHVRTPHPLLTPIRERPGILVDVTAALGLDPTAWRAALFVLGATTIDLRVHVVTDAEAPAQPGPAGRCW